MTDDLAAVARAPLDPRAADHGPFDMEQKPLRVGSVRVDADGRVSLMVSMPLARDAA